VLFIVTFYCKSTKKLTFENMCKARNIDAAFHLRKQVGSRGAQALLRMVAKALDASLLYRALRSWRRLCLPQQDPAVDAGTAEWVAQGVASSGPLLQHRHKSKHSMPTSSASSSSARRHGREAAPPARAEEEEMWSASSDSHDSDEEAERQQTLLRLEVPFIPMRATARPTSATAPHAFPSLCDIFACFP
jgi:hypothetical protein